MLDTEPLLTWTHVLASLARQIANISDAQGVLWWAAVGWRTRDMGYDRGVGGLWLAVSNGGQGGSPPEGGI